MIKKEIAEGVRLIAGNTNTDAKLDKQLVYWAADLVRGNAIIKAFAVDQSLIGDFFEVYDKDLVRKGDNVYVNLAGSVVNLPNNGGIISVNDYTSVRPNHYTMYKGLESIELHNTTYRIINDRIYLTNAPDDLKTVQIMYIPTIRSLQEWDNVPMPMMLAQEIIVLTYETLREKNLAPEDRQIDTA